MNRKYHYLKDDYLEERRKTRSIADPRYSARDIAGLRDMAERDVYPDGRFSDEECNIWSMFHNFHMKES